MFTETDFNMNILVSNIVGQNRYSHCRLCLQEIGIQTQYLRFHEPITVDKANGKNQPLYEILNMVLGESKITEEVPGIDAVCMNCAEKCFEAYNFLHQCKNSTFILDRVFTNLLNMLYLKIDNHSTLYISVNQPDSQCHLFFEEPEIKSRSHHDIMREKQRRDNFHCPECDEILENIDTLKAHNLSYHETVTCEICFKTFLDNKELLKHVKTMHSHKCPNCEVVKSNAQSLKDHQDKCHSNFICKDCGKSFQGLDKLYAHERKHALKNECPKCGKYYSTKGSYEKHVKLCLEDKIDPHPIRSKMVKTFFCEICNKGYSTEGGLRVHERFVHGNAKPHVCPHCGKQFTAPSYLKVHMVTHTGEKNFKCDICKNRFVSKAALLYHTRRHSGEKPYSCYICDEKFVNASARAEHVKFKHIGPTLKCDICSRKFVTANFLRQHRSRHNDPTSRLYTGRTRIPPNMPGKKNMRIA